MSVWSFRFGQGWKDHAPPEIQTLFAGHPEPVKNGVLAVEAHSCAGELRSACALPLYKVKGGIDGVFDAFHVQKYFFEALADPTVDVSSLMFINNHPETFALSARPDGFTVTDIDPLQGLMLFAAGVADSLRAKNGWSACDWVMLSCDRQP